MVRSSNSTVQSPEPKVQNLKTETVACSHLETVSFKYMGWIKLSVKSTASKRKVGWYATPPTSLVLGLSRLSERFCRCIVPVLTLGHLGHAVTCTARVYHTSKPSKFNGPQPESHSDGDGTFSDGIHHNNS